jgi:hypothetical protein
MSEVINGASSPEQVVFVSAYSFAHGESDEDTNRAFFTERANSVKEGAKTWLPRTLDAYPRVCADLYIDGKIAATLVFDYDDNSASVYTTSEGGSFGDTSLCVQISFAEAVAAAEHLVS